MGRLKFLKNSGPTDKNSGVSLRTPESEVTGLKQEIGM